MTLAFALTPVPASTAGALLGYEIACDCGLTWRVALATAAEIEGYAHQAWHAHQAAR